MKHIRKFETFDFNQTIPVTTKNFLTNFYSCDECDAVWKEFNNTTDVCKFCNSNEVEHLEESEWYEIAKSRMSPEEFNSMEKERQSSEQEAVDLYDVKKMKPKHAN